MRLHLGLLFALLPLLALLPWAESFGTTRTVGCSSAALFLLRSSFAGEAPNSPRTEDNNNGRDKSEEDEGIPLLPAATTGESRQIELGGEALKMDDLGPIIINADGTTRRISNWDTLSKQEKESSWRLIAARNKRRIEDLERKQKENQPES